ncbi:MAG: DUF4325 domain-containing protein [Acidobacteria bacterium]|nr:DUF4325 domain-containing protein [Acidobacteriota bacterium]
MDVRKVILDRLRDKGSIKVSDVVRLTGFSRVYVHRFFKQLSDEGRILRTGKANQAHYVLLKERTAERLRRDSLRTHRILRNRGLSEDAVLAEIKAETGIFLDIPANIAGVLDYSFTEMLNNAIEHSRSESIDVVMIRAAGDIRFQVSDSGIGIFNNMMETRNLSTEWEAIQDLLKGKQTTAPEAHSGEGIFFTSKVADQLSIRSSTKKLVFDNLRDDVFVRNIRQVNGTKVSFSVGLRSRTELSEIFSRYTDDSFEFSRTTVRVKLYRKGVQYVSRSQARRIVSGLDRFRVIELDFEAVETIGQGFADEIFRVWQSHHPDTRIMPTNAGEAVIFMIRHVAPGFQLVYNSRDPAST